MTHELSMTTTTSSPVCWDQTSCALDVEFVVPLMSSDTNILRPFPELNSSYSGVNMSSAPIMIVSAGVQSSLNLSRPIEGRELRDPAVEEDVALDIGGVGKAARAS